MKGNLFLRRTVLVAPLVSMLAACATGDAPSAAANPPIASAAQSADTPVAPGAESAAALASGQMTHPTAEIYPAEGSLLGGSRTAGRAQTSVSEQGDITLNFVNADVKNLVAYLETL